MSSYIEFNNVKKTYKMGEVNIDVLNGAYFKIEKGEFVIIAAASGDGKSTILNILGEMDNPINYNPLQWKGIGGNENISFH